MPSTEIITCDCSACGGRSSTVDLTVFDGMMATQRVEMTHTVVQAAHGVSPVARILAGRYSAQAV